MIFNIHLNNMKHEYKHNTIEEMATIENLPIELIKIKLKYI